MGKTKPSFKRFTKLIFNPLSLIIFILILNISILFVLLYLNEQNDYQIKVTKNLLSNIQSANEQELAVVTTIETRINDIKNIDNKILEIKQAFFANALAYETLVLQGQGSKKIAYLTIDDGPYSYTPAFLDVFDRYDVLASFFLLGKPNEVYDSSYKRISNSGHTICNHTYSHAIRNGLYNSTDSFINDVLKQENFLQGKLGIKTNIVRFPGGSSTAGKLKKSIVNKLREHNYGYIDWNISTGDASGSPTRDSSYYNVINNLGNKRVIAVLMHDFSGSTLQALPSLIEELKRRDFIFLPLFYESAMVIK